MALKHTHVTHRTRLHENAQVGKLDNAIIGLNVGKLQKLAHPHENLKDVITAACRPEITKFFEVV